MPKARRIAIISGGGRAVEPDERPPEEIFPDDLPDDELAQLLQEYEQSVQDLQQAAEGEERERVDQHVSNQRSILSGLLGLFRRRGDR